MASAEEMRQTLVTLIMNELDFEFAQKHLALNLVNTINVTYLDGKTYIEIPAPVYNMAEFMRSGTIERRGHGSYASKLDQNGSRWKNHKGYVERCIDTAIQKWKAFYNIDTKIKEEEVHR